MYRVICMEYSTRCSLSLVLWTQPRHRTRSSLELPRLDPGALILTYGSCAGHYPLIRNTTSRKTTTLSYLDLSRSMAAGGLEVARLAFGVVDVTDLCLK